MKASDKTIYIILALVVAAWGLNVVIVKYLTGFVSPVLVSAVRMPLAGIVLIPFVWRKYGFYKPNRKQWLLIFYIGLTSIFFHQLFLAYGVVSTSATNASLILGLNPLVTALLAALFVGENMNWRLLVGIVFGFSGVVLAVTSKSADSSISISGWGDLIMILSMLSYVVGGLFVKKISATSIPTLVITAYSTLVGGILLNIGALVVHGPTAYHQIHFPFLAWVVLFLSAWGASTLGTLGWNFGIKMLGAGKTAMFLNGMPFASMVGALIFLGEPVRWIHVAAFILTTFGIVIGTAKPKKGNVTPQPSGSNTKIQSEGLSS